MTSPPAILDVWLEGDLVGHLSSPDGRDLHFTYVEEYRESSGATPVSLSMPLTRRDHSPDVVTGFFEALLPEPGPARERLEREAGVSRLNLMGLLDYVGVDLPGALRLVAHGHLPPTEGDVRWLSDTELAERIADLRQSAATGSATLAEHGQWSLAGAQAKLALTMMSGQWGVPHGSAPTTHIVKPAIPGFEMFDAFEVICLRAARTIGLSTAEAWLQRLVDGTHAAVVLRFDRANLSDGSIRRVHQEDLCQAMGYPAWQKYERDGGPSVHRVGQLLNKLSVISRHDSAQRVFDALAFNYAIAGTDGHARNFSLLLTGADVTLAPLYDLNTALPYTRPWGRRFDSVRKLHSSFIIGASDAFTRITAEHWRDVARQLGLDPRQSVVRVKEIADAAPAAFAAASAEVSAESGVQIDVEWTDMFANYRAACAFP